MSEVRARLAWWLYAALMRLLQTPLLFKLWWRGRREPIYRQHLAQRFGFYPGPSPKGGWVWLHAVSLGETRAAAALIQALRAAHPEMRLLLTHSTATGWAAGQGLLAPGDCQVWAPWDAPAAVQRFFRVFQPRLGLLMETEVWPGWLRAARQHGVPMVLVNARLSARSADRAGAWASLMRPAYAGLALGLAQSDADAQRLRGLGLEQVLVVGNLKYDMAIDPDLRARGQRWRLQSARPVVLLASSREGEEAMWAQAVASLPWANAVQWLLVPRHPQRVDAVATLLAQAGWGVERRSAWPSTGPVAAAEAPVVWLGDSMGEMASYCSAADVALLGGSFAPLGGQNLMEVLACACPVITGPHMHNFATALHDLQGEAVAQTPSMAQALQLVHQWLADPAALRRRGALGQQLVQAHGGAVARSVDALDAWLPKSGGREHGAQQLDA